jgi:hypothetical protein
MPPETNIEIVIEFKDLQQVRTATGDKNRAEVTKL